MSNRRCIDGGLVAAAFTPLSEDGSLHARRIPEVVEYLLAHDIVGLYILGSTGEGASLTVEERCATAEAFVRAAAGRLPVIVHVGSDCLTQSRALAKHAQEIGADAISAVSPVYFKPRSVEALVESMALIASGAPDVPFYYYHVPAATGLNYSMPDFLQMGSAEIPSLAGIKFSSPDTKAFSECLQAAGDEFQLFWGVDEMLFDALSAGAEAAVGSTYNFAAPLYQKLWDAFSAGEHAVARAQQDLAQAIVNTFVPFGPRAAQKAMMSMVGPDCGPCRLPITTLSDSQEEELRVELNKVDFFKCAAKSADGTSL